MQLTNEIFSSMAKSDIEYIPQEYRKYTNVSVFLQNNIHKQKVSKKDLFTAIDISESIGYKYLDGRRTVPRDAFIKFLIFFEYELDEIQYYLLNFSYANLYIKNKRDNAIIYCVINNFSYLQVKQYLQMNGITIL
ncbi:hypothetical protein R2F61_02220 [Mollicutes bacterium LVI A0078]|nr:hypothetical protein RZE84_02250 [Mollicutes bacterium LVI A0075]WOO91384.1 hypothetical protein R2F61_02220 [Mollicutes bacterium LVI A0078]